MPSFPVPAAVLFDLDGTLIDSEEVWNDAIRDLVRDRGGVVGDNVLTLTRGLDEVEAVAVVHDALGWRGCSVADDGAWVERRVLESYESRLTLCRGAYPLLGRLRAAGVPIGLVTSTKRLLVDLALKRLGPFDVVVCGDETVNRKPHPTPYLTAARRLGVDAGRCVAVEDSGPGAASASAAGCAVLMVGRYGPNGASGHHRVDSLTEVDLDVLALVLNGRRR